MIKGLIKGKVEINFHKGARCFEAKKAINHEPEAHGYSGGEEEDGGNNEDSVCVCVCVCVGGLKMKERRSVCVCVCVDGMKMKERRRG